MSIQSFALPLTASASTCGYCSPPGERSEAKTRQKVAGLLAVRLSCEVYQDMCDRGWRRSGTYCYKPDLRRGCCPQYPIRLDALAFKAGRSHRKLIHRWNRHILQGEGDMDAATVAPKKSKGRDNQPFNLAEALHSSEAEFIQSSLTPAHRFEVSLEPASYTIEKFELYCKYQRDIHKEADAKSVSSFKRFLVETPLVAEPIEYGSESPPEHLPKTYGSYHQLYRVDGKLIAVGVLDILPKCISSVYFMYDAVWEHYSLGKLSALREAVMVKEIHDAGVPDMRYSYLGFYIYSCQKMRYKGEYSPSFLADPETYEWYPLEKCVPLLQKNRYACFSDPSHSIEGEAPSELPNAPEPDLKDLEDVQIVVTRSDGRKVAVPVPWTTAWDDEDTKASICSVVEGLGLRLAEKIIWVQSL